MIKRYIMKSIRYVSIGACVVSIFVIIYVLKNPTRYSNLNEWYVQFTQEEQKSIVDKEQPSIVVDLTKLQSETLRLESEFKDFEIKKILSENEVKDYLLFTSNSKEQQHIETDNKMVQAEKTDKISIKNLVELEKIKKEKLQQKSKVILIYTGLHKQREWYNLPSNKLKNYLNNTGCKHNNCIVTYEKRFLSAADAVIFHERNMPTDSALRSLSNFRPKWQRWIFFSSETPKNSEYLAIPYDGLFNWTMTYKLTSDIYLPYLQYRKLHANDKRPDPFQNYAKGRTKTIAWLVGNCKFELRMEFAHILEHHTQVDVGGNCRDDFKNTINCTRWCDLEALKEYKFYLAFENGVCTDYITEKYWRYLELGLVPIVMGGANYSDPRLAIPGSFIDASQFSSIKELARYIDYLHKNDTAYNEYFQWKQKYKIWHPETGDWPFESYFLCKICKMLGDNLPRKVYDKLSDFWDEYTDCDIPERKIKDKLVVEGYGFEVRLREADSRARAEMANIPKDFDED